MLFDDVKAVMFVVNIAGYDEISEDGVENNLLQSLEVFEEVAKTRCFLELPIVVYFNKHSRCKEKC